MKTKEELNELKEEYETLNKKLAELSEDELEQISGGGMGCGIPADIAVQLLRKNAIEWW